MGKMETISAYGKKLQTFPDIALHLMSFLLSVLL